MFSLLPRPTPSSEVLSKMQNVPSVLAKMPGVNPGVGALFPKQSHAMRRATWKRPSQFSCWIIGKLSLIPCCGFMKCFLILCGWAVGIFFIIIYFFPFPSFPGVAAAGDFQRAPLHEMELISSATGCGILQPAWGIWAPTSGGFEPVLLLRFPWQFWKSQPRFPNLPERPPFRKRR